MQKKIWKIWKNQNGMCWEEIPFRPLWSMKWMQIGLQQSEK